MQVLAFGDPVGKGDTMSRATRAAALVAISGLILSCDAGAAVYKCVDPGGAVTYSQAPCADDPQEVRVDGGRADGDAGPADCRYAHRFAYQTATSMRQGASSSDVFDRYGGLDSLSKGAVNLINYVYGYRASDSVSAQRIAGLTRSMCQSGTLRGVSCADLPLAFTDGQGGCDASDDDAATEPVPEETAPIASQLERQAPTSASVTAPDPEVLRDQCRERYREQIDSIDRQMRDGYDSLQGEALRERRRDLRERMSRC